MITACPADDTRWLLADWLELEALCDPSAAASVHAINADPSVEPDVEAEGVDDEGARHEERIARMTREIEVRRAVIGDAYPFALSSDGARLERGPQASVGATVYLFCLLASHGRAGGFLVDSDLIAMNHVPDLLQACATWSAAGYEDGPAHAIGLDPGTNSFLTKLARVYAAFGDGTPVSTVPPGAPMHVKDDGIDVIAWKAMADNHSPATYLLAQVASGRNWVDKSVKTAIEVFHATWFRPPPARTAKPSMMMPFCIDSEFDDDENVEQEALAMHWRRIVGKYGELLYRYRLPRYAALGLGLHARGIHVDMADWQPRVERFVNDAIANLRAHSR